MPSSTPMSSETCARLTRRGVLTLPALAGAGAVLSGVQGAQEGRYRLLWEELGCRVPTCGGDRDWSPRWGDAGGGVERGSAFG